MYKIGLLGALNPTGQLFIQLLNIHPQFTLEYLAADPEFVNKDYISAVHWVLKQPCPASVAKKKLLRCDPSEMPNVNLVFSCLDGNVVEKTEEAFAKSGIPVFSVTSANRFKPFIPILMPYINSSHLKIIRKQQTFKDGGFIVTCCNCSCTGLAIILKAFEKKSYSVEAVTVCTLQAIAGAGYPGLQAYDIFDNVIPNICGEETKLETEPQKMLGFVHDGDIVKQSIKISAMTHRVPIAEGHTLSVSIKFSKDITPDLAKIVLDHFEPDVEAAKLPSCPKKVIILKSEEFRPQPRLDIYNMQGMAVTVGQIRQCPINDIKLTLTSHNSILGLAGSAILSAELAVSEGYI